MEKKPPPHTMEQRDKPIQADDAAPFGARKGEAYTGGRPWAGKNLGHWRPFGLKKRSIA